MSPRRPPGRKQDEPAPIPPPNSLEMEQSAIGAMLMLDEVAVARGVSKLHPRHFYRRINFDTMQAIRRIEARRRKAPDMHAVDLVSVHEELRTMGALRDETYAYLSACIESCPSSVNIDVYINTVVAKSRGRYLLILGRRIERETLEPDADHQAIQDNSQKALAAIAAQGWCDIEEIFAKAEPCGCCGNKVKRGEGYRERVEGVWTVTCDKCRRHEIDPANNSLRIA